MGVCTSCGKSVADDEMFADTCADCAGMSGDSDDKDGEELDKDGSDEDGQ